MASKYPEFKQLDLADIHKEVLNRWKADNTFEKSISEREGKPAFTFYEGPPSANGLPGIHHVMGRAIKDIFCRFKTLEGFQVKRKAGWDTHGLPVELGVEKELGITKEDIGKKISVTDYNDACRKAVMRYTDIWNKLTEDMGYWVDMNDPYVTYKTKYIESVWWVLKQLWNKELIYKGYSVQPYSPKAGTGLSTHELNQPGTYREVKDTSMIAQFKAIRNDKFEQVLGSSLSASDECFFIAWTTTPWTLPSNTALTVGPKIDYVLVKTFNQYTGDLINVVLAKPLMAKYFKAEAENLPFGDYKLGDKMIPWSLLWTGVGTDLVDMKYEQLLQYAQPFEDADQAFRIISGDFVTTEDGTGIVHTAPTFGADDAKVAKDAGVPPMLVLDENDNPVPLVDLQGRFTSHMGEFAHKYVKNEYYNDGEAPEKSIDVEIAIKLKEENRAFKVEKYVHSYPHCWRTDKPILYYPLDSWFVQVSAKRDRMVELNKEILWKPKATGEGRFGNWLENANDWNLSRSRFWGIPLPIWSTEDGTEKVMYGSVQELKEACDNAVEKGIMKNHPLVNFEVGNMGEENYDAIDLHRHIVDDIILESPKGQLMKRESDLIDVWFDSGSMPYAQWHYPFENQEIFDASYPADFIAEGVDQTRGWFYTMHAIASMAFDKVAYKAVVSNGLVLDKTGQKMSKRLGNAVDPFTTLDTYGADAVRWYMISNAQPWDNLKFDLDGIAEIQRKFFGTLYNTYGFFALYANIDGFTPDLSKASPLADRPELDRWILSRLEVLKASVKESFNSYEPTKAARSIMEFVNEELSNWYVRLCRRRFWKGEMNLDKQMAYESLFECLESLSQLISPIAPFFADWLYQNIGNDESVHLSYYPELKPERIDISLNNRMQLAQKISSLGLALRKKEGIKVRQPLQKIMIPVLRAETEEYIKEVEEIIKSELNIKELQLLKDVSGILVKKIKPDFKKLGPKFGPKMKLIAASLSKLNQEEISQFEAEMKWTIDLEGNPAEVLLKEVEILTEDIPGWLVATEGGITVAMDVNISEDLQKEGIARELINRIQNLRKDSGLEVTDKISVEIQAQADLTEAVESFKDYICDETLCLNLELKEDVVDGQTIEFDHIMSQIKLSKINS